MKRSVRGFTLIELLVVIAIIAILAAILFPYIKNYSVFGCPASDFVPKSAIDIDANNGTEGKLTYGWNATVFNYPSYFLVKQSDLDRPSKTVFLCDTVGRNWVSLLGPAALSVCWNDPAYGIGDKNGTHPSKRHNGSANVAYCDGHAGSVQYDELIKTESGQGRKVAVLDKENHASWTRTATRIFPYFMVSASGRHF